MKGAGIDYPFAAELVRLEDEPVVAAAEDSPLAALVDKDERLRARPSGDSDEPRLDARVGEGLTMERGGYVIAELADVASGDTPALAGDYGRGDLASGKDSHVAILDFGAAQRVLDERDYGVGGVEADADKIDLCKFRHFYTVNARAS
jgi:hypothetical protein